MDNFWKKLNRPFFCLAPMEEVTDVAFREMFALYSNVSNKLKANSYKLSVNNFVMFTEFVNVDGILHPEGFEKLKQDLYFTEIQRPIVAQIWGNNPEKFYEATKLVKKMGFDGVDINMGCPQEKEIKINSCAALIRDPKLAGEIIKATQEGARQPLPAAQANGGLAGDLPVSVKTRIGYTKPDVENWIGFLLTHNLSAITVHGRTKKEMSKVPANWGEIKKAVELRDQMQPSVIARSARLQSPMAQAVGGQVFDEAISNQTGLPHPSQSLGVRNDRTFIIGNGDVKSREEGLLRVKETGVDGVMIARGAFGNPWLFREDGHMPNAKEKLTVMLEHAENFEKWLPLKSFQIMRKHFKAYASGFDNSAELRAKLMETKNLAETRVIVNDYLKSLGNYSTNSL